jgi:WD40 repeat protein
MEQSLIYSLAFVDPIFLASGSFDKNVTLWNLNDFSNYKTFEGHTGSITSLIVLKSGNLVSASRDTTIKIWPNII